MTIHATKIKQLIENGLTTCTALVEGKDGVHFTAAVITPDFIGKNRVQKQQMVYATLGNNIRNGRIHALSIKTFTPEEWASQHIHAF